MLFRSFIIWSFVLVAIHARSQSSAILEPSKDTYINTVIADKYQGKTQSFITAGWTYGGTYGEGRSLLGFDFCTLPDSFFLVSATLHLFHDYSASHAGHTTSGLNSAKLFEVTSYWDESTTWASQPSHNPSNFAVVPSSISSIQNYSIDVTGIVSSAMGTSSQVDFLLKLDSPTAYRSLVFASSDHPDVAVRPKLELIYFSDTTWCEYPPVPGSGTNLSSEIENCIQALKVPNVFTPNGDFTNDYFKIDLDCSPETFEIKIINRWGDLVFESNDQAFQWDGKNKNRSKDLVEGVYFYHIRISDNQNDALKSGSVTLIR